MRIVSGSSSLSGKRKRKAFSLLEMTVVLAVMGILVALSIPSVNRVLRSANLNASGRGLMDQINLARQTAQSKNIPVEVRLYRLPPYNAGGSGSPEVFRGHQLFTVGDTVVPFSKPEFFKSPVVISAGTNESAFLCDTNTTGSSHAQTTPAETDPKLGANGLNYQYVAFRFLPSGGTDLSTGKNFVTLVLQDDKPVAEGGNFFTVQVDPVNGAVRSFRP